MATATKQPVTIQSQYPDLRAGSGVNWQNVNGQVLKDLETLAEKFKQTFTLTSGYRSPSQSIAMGGTGSDVHTQGIAADVTVGGKPLGDVFSVSQIASVGLTGGNTSGFWPGHDNAYPRSASDPAGADPVHVQLGVPNPNPLGIRATQAQQSNAALIIKSAEGKGLSLAQSDALVGASYAESGLSENAVNKNSGAFGLFQLLSSGYVNAYHKLIGQGESPSQANIDAILPSYVDYFKKNPNAAPGQAAAAVEASGQPASWYASATTTANELLGFAPGTPESGSLTPFQSTGGITGGFGLIAQTGATGAETAAKSLTGWAAEIPKLIKAYGIRVGEFIAGAGLILLGIIMLGKGAATTATVGSVKSAGKVAVG